MIKSFVILYLFFGGGNGSSMTSEKFDTMEECLQAFSDAKASFSSSDSWDGLVQSKEINLNRSRCIQTTVAKANSNVPNR